LITYVRDKQANRLVGTVVAIDAGEVGWSQCCKKDQFDKKRGVQIAYGRAVKGTQAKMAMSTKELMNDAVEEMDQRSRHYFKTSS